MDSLREEKAKAEGGEETRLRSSNLEKRWDQDRDRRGGKNGFPVPQKVRQKADMSVGSKALGRGMKLKKYNL